MRRFLSLVSLPHLIARVAVALLATWLLFWAPFSREPAPSVPVQLEIGLASATAGSLSIRVDEGHGLATNRPAKISEKFAASVEPKPMSLALPPGQVSALRVSFFSTPGVALQGARIHLPERVLEIKPEQIKAVAGTDGQMRGERFLLRPINGGPIGMEITFPSPIYTPSGDEMSISEGLLYVASIVGLLWLVQILAGRGISQGSLDKVRGWLAILWRGANLKPPMTLGAVALFAAIVSCAPVVFGDRSFVAPANGAPLLYFGGATIPGAPPEVSEDPKGADVAAMMWQNVPYSVIEHRALTVDHEWPLWNRYSSGGVPLLGQGLSMLGDPLHLLPMLTGGAAWAWDLKFLMAKMLFGFGLGLGAWSLTRRLGIAMLLTVSSAWIGFFAFRFNHPAFFSVCYAPWVLLPWLAIRRAGSRRAQWGWAAALVLSDFMELASGAAKEPSMLLLCLNATGLLALLLESSSSSYLYSSSFTNPEPERVQVQVRGRGRGRFLPAAFLCWASVLFLLLSAPCWLVFLDALRQASTISDTPNALQLQPGLLLAFFDDIFSQDFTHLENHTHPSLNFLVLAGVLWLVAAWRRTLADRATLGLALGSLLPLALVFGVVPPGWITALPFIGNLQHIYNVFGCVLVILLPLLAAVGLADCCGTAMQPEWGRTWRHAMIVGGVIALAYLGFTQAVPQSDAITFKIHAPLHSRFYLVYAPAILLALVLFLPALRWMRRPGTRAAGLALVLVCGVVMHFRHGMYSATKFDDYVMNPKTGVDLFAQSPAIDRIARRQTEPTRTYGLGYVLSPGYNALLGVEGLCGPDALMNREYREFLRAAQLPLDLDWRLRIDEATLPQFQRIYDSLNLRFYLRDGGPAVPVGLQQVGRADLEIFESPTVWPRAFFTDQAAGYRTPDEYAAMVRAGDGRPFAARQMDGTTPPLDMRTVVPANHYLLSSNSTEFTVEAPSVGVVVLTENFEEGNFRVTVNGKPAEYFRVNHMHKGIAVPGAGTYQVRFTYWPRMLTLSLWLTALGLVLAVLTPLFARWWASRNHPLPLNLPQVVHAAA